ncbi:hypothetical protein WUBG_08244 [Wuchereria bancrofti]|uniref:Rabaptin GTPase-Rab5 binding domain-containing protein n=1 Tax=Wuchereria bancrofti TaxID=6293 RepID=J9EF95_WUCBA|nr:hypothetical protein WUBG_08244 [Wuchereria bancrofti]
MSMENLDVITSGKVLTNQLSDASRDDGTAASVLESTIENHGKWIIQKENNSSDAMNQENKISDTICEEDVTAISCEMCHNYELNLTKMQDAERNLKEQLSAAQHLVNRYQNELSGERLYRREMETKTTTLCADNEKEVNIAKNENENCSKQLTAVDERCVKLIREQRNNIGRLKERLNIMNKDMHNLSSRYLKLLGANRKCSTEMRDQTIELPQDVDQLQFLCLQLREELIETRAAKEHAVCFRYFSMNIKFPKQQTMRDIVAHVLVDYSGRLTLEIFHSHSYNLLAEQCLQNEYNE